jgi:hypothetical protein
MSQDREAKERRDLNRRKPLSRLSAPSSPASVAPKTAPQPKRKRKVADEGKRAAKKRSSSVDEIEEEEGAAPVQDDVSLASPGPSTASPSSALSTPRPRVRPSMLSKYATDDEDDDVQDLDTLLRRATAHAQVFGSDSELSEPPTPDRSTKKVWKKTVHPG